MVQMRCIIQIYSQICVDINTIYTLYMTVWLSLSQPAMTKSREITADHRSQLPHTLFNGYIVAGRCVDKLLPRSGRRLKMSHFITLQNTKLNSDRETGETGDSSTRDSIPGSISLDLCSLGAAGGAEAGPTDRWLFVFYSHRCCCCWQTLGFVCALPDAFYYNCGSVAPYQINFILILSSF